MKTLDELRQLRQDHPEKLPCEFGLWVMELCLSMGTQASTAFKVAAAAAEGLERGLAFEEAAKSPR